MKLKGLNICSFDPFDEFGLPKGTRYRQHNNPFFFSSAIPIALDNSTSDGTVKSAYSVTASTQTYSFTVGAGLSNSMLIVKCHIVQNGDYSSGSQFSGITYNGVALTLGYRNTQYNLGSNAQTIGVEFWYLANPSTGANNIVLTLASTTVYSVFSGAVSLYNVKQTSPIGATAHSEGTGSGTKSTAITPTISGSWIMDGWMSDGSTAGTFSSQNKTEMYLLSQSAPNNAACASQYDSSPTIGGSNTLSWSLSGTGQNTGASIEILEA